MMKLLFAFLLLPMLLPAAFVLSDGDYTVPLVVPAEQTPAQQTALQELTEYLNKITGKKFQVLNESETIPDSAIFLGPTQFAAKQKITLSQFGEEEWMVKIIGKNLLIAGGEPRGTLYGVYHFLETVLGVRWLTPHAEYVPQKEKLELEELDLRGKPRMLYRNIYLVPGHTGHVFQARNRMNTEDRKYGGRLLFSRFPGGTSHTLYTALGNADYMRKLYQQHPEYFPLIDGVRKFDSDRANGAAQTQFCMTNVELRKLWVSSLREHIRKDRELAQKNGIQPPMFYAIDQNDCYDGFCTCPNCNAIVEHEKSKAGLMLDFVNHVAKELKEEAPEAVFQMMAIHSTEPPPKSLQALDNVGIRLCDTTSNVLKPWSDPVNAKHRSNLENWAKICHNIVMWDYSISYGSPITVNFPMPTARTYAPDLRMLAENNGAGVFFEHEQVIGADMRDLKIWIEFKLAENPLLEYENLLQDFTDHYYGNKAAVFIREYLALLGTAADNAKAHVSWFPSLSSFSYIDSAILLEANSLLDQAMLLAADNQSYAQRIEEARLSLDRLYLIRAAAYRKMLQNSGKNPDLLPDYAQTKARYLRVWDRRMAIQEEKVRENAFLQREYESNVTKLLAIIEKRTELPHPEQFKNIAPASLFLFGTGMAQTYIKYLKLVKDSESLAGEALCAAMTDVEICPHENYRGDKFKYPFHWSVWPTMTGTAKGVIDDAPKALPQGYHWYKLGSGLSLTQTSVVSMFAGFFVALDGVVSDNSELGQKYEIWASIKVTGSDFFSKGQPGKDNVFYIDQFAIIQLTHNAK
ncbi:MAG: DUF4838 domain-containing protein [Lentisphaeria bacterium]